MIRKTLAGIVVFVVIVVAGFWIYAWRAEIVPLAVAPKASDFSPALIAQGRVLASAGYCVTCHTAQGGPPFAGNYAMQTSFGTIYSSNITPDVRTGIGSWSEAAFARAMREGVDRRGRHLFPAFPYEHFSRLTDQDIDAIYAYLMSAVAPVHAVKKANGISFPLNLRMLQAGWALLYADTGPFVPDPDETAVWNRGAYLAEGIAHCSACHTPRGALGGELHKQLFAGADIDGWAAPPLTGANPSLLAWTEADYYDYLRTGNSPAHGSALGPMAPVVRGLAPLSDGDIHALADYLASFNGRSANARAQGAAALALILAAQAPQNTLSLDPGARLYASACASCHYSSGPPVRGRPLLPIDTITRLDSPANLIHVMLDGSSADEGIQGVVMPGFRHAFSDAEISAVAAYLRGQTGLAAWPDLTRQVTQIRAQPVSER